MFVVVVNLRNITLLYKGKKKSFNFKLGRSKHFSIILFVLHKCYETEKKMYLSVFDSFHPSL